MKILFSTGSLFYLPIEEVFEVVRETGFDGCELVANRNLADGAYLDRVLTCAGTLPVLSVHAPYAKIPAWGGMVEAFVRTIGVANRMKAEIVNFHPPAWFTMEVGFIRWFRSVRDFHLDLPCGDVLLTLENMARVGKKLMLAPYVLNDYADLISFGVQRNLFFTLDVTHLASFETDVIAAFLEYHRTGRLKNIHFSDYGNGREHLFPGKGEVPLVKLLNTMRRVGYDGLVTLELAPNEWPRSGEWLVKMMRSCNSFMRFHLGID